MNKIHRLPPPDCFDNQIQDSKNKKIKFYEERASRRIAFRGKSFRGAKTFASETCRLNIVGAILYGCPDWYIIICELPEDTDKWWNDQSGNNGDSMVA